RQDKLGDARKGRAGYQGDCGRGRLLADEIAAQTPCQQCSKHKSASDYGDHNGQSVHHIGVGQKALKPIGWLTDWPSLLSTRIVVATTPAHRVQARTNWLLESC